MTAWAATAVREEYPDAFIGWVAESRCTPVLDTTRLVDHLVDVPRERWKKERRWIEPLRVFAGLRKFEFDFGFDPQGHSKTAICLRLARPKRRLAARATDVFARSLNPVMPQPKQTLHEVDLNLALVRQLLPVKVPNRPIMPSLDADRERVRTLVRSPGRLVTIQTGAGAADKIVPAETWALVARGLLSEGFRVVALGGPGDPRIEMEGVLNLVGGLSLREAMAAVAESEVHLAGDTGTGHIAAALGVPVVSVFGPTEPARFRPYAERAKVLRHALGRVEGVRPDEIVAATLEQADSR